MAHAVFDSIDLAEPCLTASFDQRCSALSVTHALDDIVRGLGATV